MNCVLYKTSLLLRKVEMGSMMTGLFMAYDLKMSSSLDLVEERVGQVIRRCTMSSFLLRLLQEGRRQSPLELDNQKRHSASVLYLPESILA